jgi:transposase
VLEATGLYHEAFALFLHHSGVTVSVINPLDIKLFARSRGTQARTDEHDGRLLALFGA